MEEGAPVSWPKPDGNGAAADAQSKMAGLSGDASTSEVACHIEIHTDPEQVVVASLDEPKPAQEGADDYDNEGLTQFDRELLRHCPRLTGVTLAVQSDTVETMDTLPMSDVAKATEAKESVPSPDAIDMGDSAKAEKPKDSTKTRAPKKGDRPSSKGAKSATKPGETTKPKKAKYSSSGKVLPANRSKGTVTSSGTPSTSGQSQKKRSKSSKPSTTASDG